MRILVFGMTDIPGGIERYVFNYYPYLKEKGIFFDFISLTDHIAYERFFIDSGAKIIRLPSFKINPIKYYLSLKNYLKKEEYDAVYVNMLSAANILPLLVSKSVKMKRIIVHAHNNAVPSGLLRKILHKINTSKVELIGTDFWACSVSASNWLFPTIQQEKRIIVANAIDVSQFAFNETSRKEIRDKYHIKESDYVIGMVGRFQEQKNHSFAIKVIEELVKTYPSAKLLLVGKGDLFDSMSRLVKQMAIEDNVIFAGGTESSAPFYSAMDAFIFPSLFEGFGIAAIEAESSGLPCLVSDTVPSEVDITNQIIHLPLESTHIWVEKLSSLIELGPSSKEDRAIISRSCLRSPYSLVDAEKKLVNLFIQGVFV